MIAEAVLGLFGAARGRLITLALVGGTGSRVHGLQQSWHTGLVALQQLASPLTRDRTCVSCIGRRILNHWTTRKVLQCSKHSRSEG